MEPGFKRNGSSAAATTEAARNEKRQLPARGSGSGRDGDRGRGRGRGRGRSSAVDSPGTLVLALAGATAATPKHIAQARPFYCLLADQITDKGKDRERERKRVRATYTRTCVCVVCVCVLVSTSLPRRVRRQSKRVLDDTFVSRCIFVFPFWFSMSRMLSRLLLLLLSLSLSLFPCVPALLTSSLCPAAKVFPVYVCVCVCECSMLILRILTHTP